MSHLSPSSAPGRPGIFTPALQELIAGSIRELGWSDTMAGQCFGVSSSTISRWKQQHEGFAFSLTRARAEFLADCQQKILAAKTRDGRPDWRALVYLLQRAEKHQLRSEQEAEQFLASSPQLPIPSKPASHPSQNPQVDSLASSHSPASASFSHPILHHPPEAPILMETESHPNDSLPASASHHSQNSPPSLEPASPAASSASSYSHLPGLNGYCLAGSPIPCSCPRCRS